VIRFWVGGLEAERILEEDHYGLEKVKRRILEYRSLFRS
jgi:ATP-dependent Lon protease